MSWKSKKSFSQRWEATRKKGKAKYVLCYILAMALFVVCSQGFSLLIHKSPISSLRLSDLLLGTGMILILGALFSFLSWSANESQYKAIKEKETLQSIQEEQDRSDTFANAVFAYVDYGNKIYRLTQIDSYDESLVDEKIQSKEFEKESYDFYKIKQVDTDKAIALRDANSNFCKYEYLCEESFTWENRVYKISCTGGALENESNDPDFECNVGKALGKIGSLALFENKSDGFAKSLLVHPDGLACETGTGKDGYFLATSKDSASNASK